jgi:hypothetical protein
MKLDIPNDYVPLLITALEQYYTYTRAVQREDNRYQQAADWFRRQRTPIIKKQVPTREAEENKVAARRPARKRGGPFFTDAHYGLFGLDIIRKKKSHAKASARCQPNRAHHSGS